MRDRLVKQQAQAAQFLRSAQRVGQDHLVELGGEGAVGGVLPVAPVHVRVHRRAGIGRLLVAGARLQVHFLGVLAVGALVAGLPVGRDGLGVGAVLGGAAGAALAGLVHVAALFLAFGPARSEARRV